MVRRRTTIRNRDREYFRRIEAPCGICGDPIDYKLPYLDPGSFVVDHIMPLALGGGEERSNKQAAHRSCNGTKGKRKFAPIVKRSGSLS